jgi:mRNA-degrading endonuclease RelE of RelBE toxin-antitoxin system
MRVAFSVRARDSYRAAPPTIQRAVQKQTRLLAGDLKHPSLHAKKYDEGEDIWQARITRDWRMYFIIEGDAYFIVDITAHP